MRNPTTKKRARTARLLAAVTLTLTALGGIAVPSSAVPSSDQAKRDLDAAQAKLADLQNEVSRLAEEYNQAREALDETTQELEQKQQEVDKASSEAKDAQQSLRTRVGQAYEGGVTSQIDVLLGANDFTEFSDRLEYLNRLAADDAALAAKAQVAGQTASWAADDLATLKQKQQEQAVELEKKKQAVEDAQAEQEALVAKYEDIYKQALEAERQAAIEARKQAAQEAAAAEASGGSGGDGSSGGDYSAPPSSSGASVAVKTALAQVGDEYQWGAAGPDEFDCSGLMLYAWRAAGVSLPHSSAGQYASLPHVSKSDLQPGDLVFFYNPIHHVGMYIGGGQMVHAYSEGKPVSVDSIGGYYASEYVGAARPG